MSKPTLEQYMQSPSGRILKWALSLLLGLFAGVVLHFVLYRIALPVEPFIYVAF